MKLCAWNVYADDTRRQVLAEFPDRLGRIYVNYGRNTLRTVIVQEITE